MSYVRNFHICLRIGLILFGGNMFWISNDTLNRLTDDLIDFIISKVVYGKPPCNLTDPNIHIEYICERLFTGILCYDKTNILINEFYTTQRSISAVEGIIDNKYFYNPRVFSIYKPQNIVYN